MAAPDPCWSTSFETFNPAHWLTGGHRWPSSTARRGHYCMEIPDCASHTCASADSLPIPTRCPRRLPQYMLKGPFEALFNGAGGGLKKF